jgi:uncharacterized protein (TIGR00299 family) protein
MTRALFLDCFGGISGNMFFGAMLDLGLDERAWREAIAKLPLDDVELVVERVTKRGVRANHGDVRFPHQHVHRGLGDCLDIVEAAGLDDAVSARAEAIFRRLAEAEAEVHGTTVDEVHFHEVGAVDAIVDVVSAAFLLEASGAERVVASPVRTGFGTVNCAHGVMPVPAPATALLLRDMPTYAGDVEGELTTPTGAAILAASVNEFRQQPPMRVEAIGWGAGTKDTPHPNCLRALLGTLEAPSPRPGQRPWVEERLVEVECNIDDMTGEDLGFLVEELLAGPAVDALVLPATGKKGRPAHVVRALALPEKERDLLDTLFRHSTTLGARVRWERRVRVDRDEVELDGLRAKRARDGRVKVELDDLARLARAESRSLAEVRRRAMHALSDHEGAEKS